MPSDPRGGLGYLLVGQPSISSLVARALATKGDQPQYLEGRYELGVTALDLTDPEYRWLRRSQMFEAHIGQAAVAAQFGYASLGLSTANLGRNVLAVIESVMLSNTTAGRLGYNIALGVLALGAATGPFFGQAADDRSLDATGAANSAGVAFGGTSAAPGMTLGRSRFASLAAGTSLEVKGPWILSGKSGPAASSNLVVLSDTLNVSAQVSFRWRERELLASET